MSTFVHVNQPLSHPGVDRAEQVFDYVREQRRGLGGARGLAVALLAGIVAALVAVADKFVAYWTDGSLLAAWLVLWLVAFAAIALFAGATRSLAARALAGWRQVRHGAAAARADAQMLEVARRDPRLMQELQAVLSRAESEAGAQAEAETVADADVDAPARIRYFTDGGRPAPKAASAEDVQEGPARLRYY